jgi:alginate O-acetyltransferase complex protein AlgI
MLNVRLPFNFDSPYKSRNIIDFWRRWHISLSTFLRDYLYISLGGNRFGNVRRYANMGITMFLGGLWHGAGWTFIIWGILHGVYLTINHLWKEKARNWSFAQSQRFDWFSWLLTFLAVVVAWVFFRAQTVYGAWNLVMAMFGFGVATAQKVLLTTEMPLNVTLALLMISPLLAITFWAPNSQQIVAKLLTSPNNFLSHENVGQSTANWAPVRLVLGVVLGLLLGASLMLISRPSEFLYFNF